MAQRTQHIVTANLIVAQTNSVERYFDKGAILPEDVPADERKRLLARGLVKVHKVEESEGTANEPPKDPAQEPPK